MEKQNQRIKHYNLAVLGIAAGVIADQLTKYLAVVHLKDQEPFVLIENVFQLEFLKNVLSI